MVEIPSKVPNYEGKFKGQGMVVLSFDDGREDNFRVAYPIMKKYGLLGTIHITTGYLDRTYAPPPGEWPSSAGPMTMEEMEYLHREGIEMSGHGDKHRNDEIDVRTGIQKLKDWGLTRNGVVEGFSSPGSGLQLNNLETMKRWFIEDGLTHARTGAVGTRGMAAENNSSYPIEEPYLIRSNVIGKDTQVNQIQVAVMDAVRNKRLCILMLHSIIRPEDVGWNTDEWWWDAERFEELCKWLSNFRSDELLIVTMRDAVRYANSNFLSNRSRPFRRRSSKFLVDNRAVDFGVDNFIARD